MRGKIEGKELRIFCIFTLAVLWGAALLLATPVEIFEGMKKIISSRDVLTTDYFAVAGYGAALFNAGLMLLLAVVLVELVKIPYTGLTLVVIFINTGYGLWGKNPVNAIPCITGVWMYARLHRVPFARYIYTALFATCLAPFVTDMVYNLPFPQAVNIVAGAMTGLLIGYILPPLAVHTASMHMGYCLTNVGFAGGMLATVMYSVLRAMGIESKSQFLWQEGMHPGIAIGLLGYFIITFLFGLYLEGGKPQGIRRVMRHPGRAVADFIIMDSVGTTLMNMGLVGTIAEVYIFLTGGDMSGPVVGSILALFGFASFGVHLKNYLPVMAGVFLAAVLSVHAPADPAMQIAAIFVMAIAPVAGQFGVVAGVAAGMLHAALVVCTGALAGGLNLYNNGFSAGWVAIVVVPFVESFMKRFEMRQFRKNKR